MKKIILSLMVLAFFGCAKKSTPTPQRTTLESLTGLWYYTADTVNIYQNGVLTQNYSELFVKTAQISFASNGTGTEYFPGYVLFYFNFVISGSNITLNYPAQSIGNLSLPHPATEIGTIKELTDNKLVLYFDESYVSNGITYRQLEKVYFAP